MNYNYLNQIYECWRSDIFPHLVHRYSALSFDDYLKKFSYLPSGKWLRDQEKVKLARVLFPINPKDLVVKYKSKCVTYNTPFKPEDGIQRIFYQYSPTLHFESAFWMWVENKIVQSYAMAFVCYNNEDEYMTFLDDLYMIHREGDTEESPTLPGFKYSNIPHMEEHPITKIVA